MDDPELQRIARREAAERSARILRAVRSSPTPEACREVYRHAHTLAGIAPDAETAQAARRLTQIYADARGRIQAPSAAEGVEARALAEGLARRWPPL